MAKQINWEFVRDCLRTRKEIRDMNRNGYRKADPFWEIQWGGKSDWEIKDVKISHNRDYVWVKAGPKGEP